MGEKTKLLKNFSEKKQSPWKKILETDQMHFWQSVGDSTPKYDNSPLRSRKNKKTFLFSEKKTFSLNTFICAQGRFFDYHAKKTTKKLKFRWKFQ